jgi:succinyl-diaminopimelate desuccinylase
MDVQTDQIVELASRLIERPSVSPDDAGCQEILRSLLAASGFTVEALPFGAVENFWATHGSGSPIVVFAGHTDVVPSGPTDAWRYPPFTATVDGDLLYGRGSADMKGSLAAMAVATRGFVAVHPDHRGTLAWLITSDEEADAVDGTVRVVEWLEANRIRPELCLIGEPSSNRRLGDLIRIGRRGSLNGRLIVKGVQGHVAYPDQAKNPVHLALDALRELTATVWDRGNDAFPPTTLQISNLHGGTGATNVIPGELTVDFNLRYSTEQTWQGLQARIDRLFASHGLDYAITWTLSGEPFQTATPDLIDAVRDSIRQVCGIEPELSTGGGTSDGRFIARLGTAIVELGPVNATIHSVDERTSIPELHALAEVDFRILERLLAVPDA